MAAEKGCSTALLPWRFNPDPIHTPTPQPNHFHPPGGGADGRREGVEPVARGLRAAPGARLPADL